MEALVALSLLKWSIFVLFFKAVLCLGLFNVFGAGPLLTSSSQLLCSILLNEVCMNMFSG